MTSTTGAHLGRRACTDILREPLLNEIPPSAGSDAFDSLAFSGDGAPAVWAANAAAAAAGCTAVAGLRWRRRQQTTTIAMPTTRKKARPAITPTSSPMGTVAGGGAGGMSGGGTGGGGKGGGSATHQSSRGPGRSNPGPAIACVHAPSRHARGLPVQP